jgi:hypothetical protein
MGWMIGLAQVIEFAGFLFRSRLDQIIDMKHALVKLARAIDCGVFWSRRLGLSTRQAGPAAIAERLMAGLAILKHTRPFRRGFVRSLGGEPVLR